MSFIDAKLLWRDWRGGQLNLIVSSLVLAVMVVTAVSLLADRVERGLDEQISSFLAADLAIKSSKVISSDYVDRANELSLSVASVAQFRSMIFAGEHNHLASVKAVSHDYPLRGQLEVSELLSLDKAEIISHGPAKGEAWLDSRLLGVLGINLDDHVEVGYSRLKVTRLILNEPDRGARFSAGGARLMMSVDDLPASQLIRPGSQVKYSLLLAGSASSIDEYKLWFKVQHSADESDNHLRLSTPEDSEQELSQALSRGRTFLLLSGTIGVLLAGLAMALASHRYALRLTDQVALMKAWGMSANWIRRSHLIRLSLIAFVSTLIGLVCGWLAHYLLLGVANEIMNVQLPLPGWRPWFVAIVTGFVCVLGFALPALWHLPSIAPLRVLRRDIPDSFIGRGSRLFIGVMALFALTFWYSSSLTVSALFLLALLVLFTVCALIALQVLKLVQGFAHWQGSYVRLGLANLWRRRSQTLIQLVGFSATLILLLVVTGLRTNLVDEWQAQLPQDAPSHFLFNVASAEQSSVATLLQTQDINNSEWYPMVRGRIIGMNGNALARERLNEVDGLDREVNFTQTDILPQANTIVAGQWFKPDLTNSEKITFSMEQKVAQQLGINLGDTLEFSIGGIRLNATLMSIRTVDWRNMTPNFYIIFNPGALDRFSPNWLTTLTIDDDNAGDGSLIKPSPLIIQKLIREYPTAVIIELSDILDQIRNIISRVTRGLEMILLLVLACGVLVLFAAIGVSYDERLRENAILRTLGSSRRIVLGALTVEYAALGLITGLIAAIGAELILYFVQTNLFEMSASMHPNLWMLGLVSGVLLITGLGLLRCRHIIAVPPLQSLRQVSE